MQLRIAGTDCGPDPIPQLMQNTEAGFYSRILYDKEDGAGPSERIIEPRRLAESAGGVLVRSYQIAPTPGPKCFRAERILRVDRDPTPLSLRAKERNSFCTGEIVSYRKADASCSRDAVEERSPPTGIPQATRAVWSRPWFNDYVLTVRNAILDLQVDARDVERVTKKQFDFGLTAEQIRAAHYYILAEELIGFAADGWLDNEEAAYAQQIAECLSTLGGGPLI